MQKPKIVVQVSDPALHERVGDALRDIEAEIVISDVSTQEDLVGAFMHDAKNSLTSVTANISFAQDLDGDPTAIRDALADAAESAARLVRQIDDLVVLTRAQSGIEVPRRETDMAALVDGVIKRDERWAVAFGVSLRTSIPKNLHVHGDPELLGRALSEILDTAVRYCGGGASVEVGAAEDGDSIGVWVRHDGRPIDQNPRLATWMRGSRRPIEIGFGLAVAAAVAAAHGGTFDVHTPPSGWSAEMLMRLPRP